MATSSVADLFQDESPTVLESHLHDCRQLLEAKKQFHLGRSKSGKHDLPSPTESTTKRAKSSSGTYDYRGPAAQSTMTIYENSMTSMDTPPFHTEVGGANSGHMNLCSGYTDDIQGPYLDVSGAVSNYCPSLIFADSGFSTNSEIPANFNLSSSYIQPPNFLVSETEFRGWFPTTPLLGSSLGPTAASAQINMIHPADFHAIQKMQGIIYSSTTSIIALKGNRVPSYRRSPNLKYIPKQRRQFCYLQQPTTNCDIDG